MIASIEQKFKLSLIVSIGSLVTSIIMVCLVLFYSFNLIQKERQKIYVLDSQTPVLVHQSDMSVNRDIEIKSHINTFHTLFFTLPPDDEFIKNSMDKAMYLVDESGLKQYNTLKEKGYFNQILASSAALSIKTDSIKVDLEGYRFTFYGTQRIERETSILKRAIVTEGSLRDVPRTENNPHGLIITDWKTKENKDLEYKAKRNF
jgi:conjugative transposon TraK protein